MAEYRVPEFTLAQRIDVAMQMLVSFPQRKWGLVSQLAEQYGVSRTRLYEIREQARQILMEGLLPRSAGRPAQTSTVTVDKDFVERAIAVLPMLKGSVRDIGLGLELLLGVTRSVGYISETLQRAGERAALYNLKIRLPLPILAEADEIFQGRKPCLTVVDGRSFLVLNLSPAETRDGTTWGLTYLDLVERGIEFHDLACDGGTGLRAGLREAELTIPLRPDLFHLLQQGYHLSRQLEAAAYRALEAAERARRAKRESQGVSQRRGRPLKLKLPLPQAEQEEAQAIATFDLWCWLLAEIRQALEPFTPEGDLVAVAHSKATLETAISLLLQFKQPQVTAFAEKLHQKLPELLAPLTWLQQQLSALFAKLEVSSPSFLVWAWQHRQELKLDLASDIPQACQAAFQMVGETLALFHRSSSLAESLHSWLRPYLQIHRGMPQWLLPLLQLFWNHHQFERGQRAGSTPLELAQVEHAPSLKAVLDQLFGSPPAIQPA